jgi:hypothetical protein
MRVLRVWWTMYEWTVESTTRGQRRSLLLTAYAFLCAFVFLAGATITAS